MQESISVSKITIKYLRKYIIIPLLFQYGFFIHASVSKNTIVFKDAII